MPKWNGKPAKLLTLVAPLLLWSHPAFAHHEAIFGPHSSSLFGAPLFVSAQLFTVRSGVAPKPNQESTGIVSFGWSPRNFPLSFAAVVPVSYATEGGGRAAVEDALLGVRYRYDLTGLQQRTGADGNFVTVVGGVEFPTGNAEHPAFRGPLDTVAAALLALERPPFSGIAYAYQRFNGHDSDGARAGNLTFAGLGLAYTPWDEPATERLFSLQLGAVWERTGAAVVPLNAPAGLAGGTAIMLQPTLVAGIGGHVLLFLTAGAPLAQQFADGEQTKLWRAGLGAVWLLGHEDAVPHEHGHDHGHDHGGL